MAANNDFDKMVNSLRDFSVAPAAADWEAIERRLQKPNRSRWMIWPLALAAALVVGYGVWNLDGAFKKNTIVEKSAHDNLAKHNELQSSTVTDSATKSEANPGPGALSIFPNADETRSGSSGGTGTGVRKMPMQQEVQKSQARTHGNRATSSGIVTNNDASLDRSKRERSRVEYKETVSASHRAFISQETVAGNAATKMQPGSAQTALATPYTKHPGDSAAMQHKESLPATLTKDSASHFANPLGIQHSRALEENVFDSVSTAAKPLFKKTKAWMIYAGLGQSKAASSLSLSANKAILEDMGGGVVNTVIVSSTSGWLMAYGVGVSRHIQWKPRLTLSMEAGYDNMQFKQQIGYRFDSTVLGGGLTNSGLLESRTTMHLINLSARLQLGVLQLSSQQLGFSLGIRPQFVVHATGTNTSTSYNATQGNQVRVTKQNADTSINRFQPAVSAGLFWHHKIGKHQAQLLPAINYSLRSLGANNERHLLNWQLRYFFQIK